jgi:DNA uptake protein ComE-like DNA-binding protein
VKQQFALFAAAAFLLNTVNQEQLEGIPGIRPTLATCSIGARPFESTDDLHQVNRIGQTRCKKTSVFSN